jgi:hypothetical protein
MPDVYIEKWVWDDGNLDELARHGLSRRAVLEVAEEAPLFRRNKRNRAASHQMIGPNRGGSIWTVCIREELEAGVWRAITGWPSEPQEITWYERSTPR